MSEEEKPILLKLSQDEALVLYEWLKVREERAAYTEAEMRNPDVLVLWELECQLDLLLAEPVRPDYAALLKAARKRVVEEAYDDSGSDQSPSK